MTQHREFDFGRPDTYVDQETGEIKLRQNVGPQKPFLRSVEDLQREENRLRVEEGLVDGESQDRLSAEELAEKLDRVRTRLKEEFEIDTSSFYAETKDKFRVDVGLLVMRPPIFMHMSERDVEFLKYRNDFMNEYNCDLRQYLKDIEEVASTNESYLARNVYNEPTNMDNYPSH